MKIILKFIYIVIFASIPNFTVAPALKNRNLQLDMNWAVWCSENIDNILVSTLTKLYPNPSTE